MEELQELVDTAKHAVPGVDAAIAAAVDRKLNPVSHIHSRTSCSALGSLLCVSFAMLYNTLHSYHA